MLWAKLQPELTCPYCGQLFRYPLLLPCGHTICATCADKLWFGPRSAHRTNIHSYDSGSNTGEDTVSEADSGVVVSGPDSGNGSLNSSHGKSNRVQSTIEACPVCSTVPKLPCDVNSYGHSSQDWWPKNVAVEHMIQRLSNPHASNSVKSCRPCELCDSKCATVTATSFCQQCKVHYCEDCLSRWHPNTELLNRHEVTPIISDISMPESTVRCSKHLNVHADFFCVSCAILLCVNCVEQSTVSFQRFAADSTDKLSPERSSFDSTSNEHLPVNRVVITKGRGVHSNHIICTATVQAKQYKTELAILLRTLSARAKNGGELTQQLKETENKLKQSAPSMEWAINRTIDDLVGQLEQHRKVLVGQLQVFVKQRNKHLKEWTSKLGARLTSTTSLLHFGVELLKESDPAAFIQAVSLFRERLRTADEHFSSELDQLRALNMESPSEWSVDPGGLRQQITSLKLEEHKAPAVPWLLISHCSVNGNAFHLVWSPSSSQQTFQSKKTHNIAIPPHLSSSVDHNPMVYRPSSVQPVNITNGCSFKSICSLAMLRINQTNEAFQREIGHLPASISAYALSDRDGSKRISTGYLSSPCVPRRVSSKLGGTSGRISSNSVNSLSTVGDDNAHSEIIESDSYCLEVDDGKNGAFRVAYTGSALECRLEGLHFNTAYRLRVRAFNRIGHSAYSQPITLRTSSTVMFYMDPLTGPSPPLTGLHVGTDGVVSATGETEDRVLLANMGFSDGKHYWEWRIEAYDGRGQPSFGIALNTVARDRMLGMDESGWAMYLNSSRSWFLHAGQHRDRTDGGILYDSTPNEKSSQTMRSSSALAVIGVRLDCDQGQLAFYLNGEPHGPVAFAGLHSSRNQQAKVGPTDNGTDAPTVRQNTQFYPAISLSHHARVRVVSGLEVPIEDSSETSEAEYDISIDSLPRITDSSSNTSGGVSELVGSNAPTNGFNSPTLPQALLYNGSKLKSVISQPTNKLETSTRVNEEIGLSSFGCR